MQGRGLPPDDTSCPDASRRTDEDDNPRDKYSSILPAQYRRVRRLIMVAKIIHFDTNDFMWRTFFLWVLTINLNNMQAPSMTQKIRN